MPKYNHILVPFKVGDKQTAKGKEYLGVKDGMPLGPINPNNYNPMISDGDMTRFAWLRMPLSTEQFFMDASQPNQNDLTKPIDPLTYRSAKKLVNLRNLETALEIPGLEADWRSGNKVSIIDGGSLPLSIFQDSTVLNNIAKDFNATTGGSVTVGVLGDFATEALLFADLGNFTSDLLNTLISAVVETAQSNITEDLGGYLFTCTSNNPPYGDITAGWKIDLNHNAYGFYFTGTNGDIKIKNLNIVHTTVANATSFFRIDAATVDLVVHDCIFNGITKRRGLLPRTAQSVKMHNIVIQKPRDWGIYYHTAPTTTENCTINESVNSGYTINNAAFTFKNCVAINSGGNDFDLNGNATGRMNASEDATAANGNWGDGLGNHPNITPGNEFETLDDTKPEFLKVKYKALAVCAWAGQAPTIAGNTKGIRGNARPHADGNISIGADEYNNPLGYIRKYW